MALAVDTNATVKMTLHTNNDNEGNWSGTDGPDSYNVLIQGSNSESWQVSKNTSETGTLALANDVSGTGNHVNFWMMSNLTQYLTSIKVQLISTAGNYREYIIATSTLQDVTGEFHCFALDITGGTQTGTFVPASLSSIAFTVDNSASGNIRSVINNWIDAMYYGRGLTFDGSDTNDKMFLESAALDELTANKYGVMIEVDEQIFVQGDLIYDDNGSANTQTSDGENVIFTKKTNTTNTYRLHLIGSNNTVVFTNTSIAATDTARFGFDSSGTVSSFTMTGGGFKKASSVAFKSGQTISNINFTECGEVDTNGATLDGCNFISTIETTTGALVVNTDVEGEACDNLYFSGYSVNSRHAVYVASGVTEFDMDNWTFDDPNNTTDYALYWAGAAGTLTINSINGTNLVTAGCESAGGTVSVVANPVTLQLVVKDIGTGSVIVGARVLVLVGDGVNFPYNASIAITGTGTTATVTHSAHGYSTGANVCIEGAVQNVYNGAYSITVVNTTTYTYTTNETISTSPATGTITATTALINTVTNGSGVVSDTRTYGANQSILGRVRMSTNSPYYKQSPISDTVDKDNGKSINVLLIKDE